MNTVASFLGLVILLVPVSAVRPAGGALANPVATVALLAALVWLLAANVGYYIYCWSRSGQTLGLRLLHLRVVDYGGAPPGIGPAILRYVGYLLNVIVCGLPIGYIWAAFDPEKQGWHDKLAGTHVVWT